MKTYPNITTVLALLLGLVGHTSAASLPGIDLGAQTKSEAESVVDMSVTELEANWWRFFEVEGEKLEQRIQKTIDRLERLPAELPQETAETARSYIARIRNNLLALPAARAQPSPTPPMPVVYAESYTISQLLEIARRQRKVQAELEAIRYDVASAEGAIQTAQRRIDTLTAAYLSLDSASPERILRGLEIIANRSDMALAEEKLRVHKAALRAHQTLHQQLASELAMAAERLRAEITDFEQVNEEIKQARFALARAQEHLNTVQARAAQARAEIIVEADTRNQATALYHQQQTLHATVAEAIARVHLYKRQAERMLVFLLLNFRDINTETLREQMSGLKAQLSDIDERIRTWTRESQRERDRAGEAMARVSEDKAAALHQERLNLAQETLVAVQRLEESVALTKLLIQQVNERLAHREGLLRTWSVAIKQALEQFWVSAGKWINLSLFKIGDTPVTALGLLRVALIIFVAWLISYWLRHMLKRLGRGRKGISQSALFTIGRLSHYAIITLGLFIGLASIGIDFTNLALVAGAIGIGVGFGLQSIVANFVSGLILLFERSLEVGDYVELASGVAGEVRAINVRSTVINTNDNVDIVVPNSQFITSDVINWTLQEDYRRIHIPFRVAYGADKELVKKAALEAAHNLEHTLKTRKPAVWLGDFAEHGLDFELVVWVTPAALKRPGSVHSAYRWEIESALKKYGIEIPVPQRDLRLHNDLKAFLRILLSEGKSSSLPTS